MHTAITKTPELVIENCEFRYFMSGAHEALIYVETTNLFVVPKEDATAHASNPKGFIKSLGVDNGANINIKNSKFEFSRFCKGMISYRPA